MQHCAPSQLSMPLQMHGPLELVTVEQTMYAFTTPKCILLLELVLWKYFALRMRHTVNLNCISIIILV
jgi:hypothetical protein